MNDRRRDRMLTEAATGTREALRRIDEAAHRDEFTHSILTGTATRLMLLLWGGAMVASFIGCALYHTLLGG